MADLRLELRGSRTLAGATLAVHLAAAMGVLAAAPGLAGLALALLIATLGGASAWHRGLLRGRRSVRAVRLSPEGRAVLELADGRELGRRVARRRYVSPRWVALPYADVPGAGLLIVRGMLEPAAFRRLRLWALWGRTPAP